MYVRRRADSRDRRVTGMYIPGQKSIQKSFGVAGRFNSRIWR